MIRLAAALAPLVLAAGAAAAQDHSHHMPPAPAAIMAPRADQAAPAASTPPPGHGMDLQGRTADPHAGHAPGAESGATGPPDVPTSADDEGRPRRPPAPPAARRGPAHAADLIWGEGRMAPARALLRQENGEVHATAVIVDRLEVGAAEGEGVWMWDVAGWTGGDINRFWWKSEAEGDFEGEAEAELQALYSRAISPYWDVQAGLRQDLGADGPDSTHLVLGLQGLAPYWWEVDGAAFLSSDGDLTARIKAEYDQRITQRLILQPRMEVEASASDVPEQGLGSGLTHVEAGLRLRYEIAREFAPYVGVDWSRDLGNTADLTRAAGAKAERTRFVMGLRAWF